jgi:cyclic 2,3-diphosphoglycerate synthase
MMNFLKNQLNNQQNQNKRLAALIDGEHYPQVNLDAIKILKERFSGNFAGIIFLGGTEKLVIDNLESYYGEKVFSMKNIDIDFMKALDLLKPDLVYDLSDEPVVNCIIRMKIASFCIARNCAYMGPDFLFEPEEKNLTLNKTSISIIGTGKRIGKTAVSSYITALFSKRNINVCIIAMGRGGPADPQIIKGSKTGITPEYLLNISRSGLHASSDYLEDALFSRVTTIGCRRCGGGFGGKFFMSNINDGVKIANKLNKDLIIIEGSGTSIAPVKTDFTICVLGADQQWDSIVGYLGIYRIILADLVFLTMCEEPLADEQKIKFLENEIKKFNPKALIIRSIFRPEPALDMTGKRIFMIMTAKNLIEDKIKKYMENKFNCKIVKISFNLANRKELKKELAEKLDYGTILTELKAASVDLVTEFAFKNNKQICYMNNIPLILEGKENLEKLINNVWKKINAK